ncbi:hypothetical protein [Candidatus Binatus soli]|jgi:hypothetical protein|uniref:hypothetical protein n=1 Tax=Candidatus Binatus soli TaxID=1953413 RepID=UPI003D0FFA1A
MAATVKPRHAAALALVGWYLILPPQASHLDPQCSKSSLTTIQQKKCDSEAVQIVLDAPLAKWQAFTYWQNLSDCEADKKSSDTPEETSLMKRAWGDLSKQTGISPDAYAAARHRMQNAGKCIATDKARALGIEGPAPRMAPTDGSRLKGN